MLQADDGDAIRETEGSKIREIRGTGWPNSLGGGHSFPRNRS